MKRGILCMAVLGALLAGCAVKPIDPDKPASVGDITVDPQLKWANINTVATSGTVWTIDGLGLDELRFYPAIEAGHPLYSANDATLPKYDASMLPDDVAEFFASTLGHAGFRQVKASDLKPKQFGSQSGFEFHLAFTTPDGLEMKGLVLASQHAKQLDAILFMAPGEYYYDRYAADIEKLFASARVGG
jgi:hypothetical protein